MGLVGLVWMEVGTVASTPIVVTKAGVSSESLPHSQNLGKSLRILALRLSELFLLLGVLAMHFGTSTLLGVIRYCRLLCTSDGVLVLAWASDVVLNLVWASDVELAWMSDTALLVWTLDLGGILCC